MTPEKRKKIKALLDSPASTPNEKEICRKLLKDNPEDLGRPVTGREVRDRISGYAAPRSPESGIFWDDFLRREQVRQAAGRGQRTAQQQQAAQEAARRQAQAVDDGIRWHGKRQAAQGQADPGRRVYPGGGPDLAKERQKIWNNLRSILGSGVLDFAPDTAKKYIENLERLRKERDE